MYIEERDELQFNAGIQEPAEFEYEDDYQTFKQDLIMLKRDIDTLKMIFLIFVSMIFVSSCGQKIDTSHLEKLKADLEDQLNEKSTFHTEGLAKATKWSKRNQRD